ncbi:MAG: c-type cytochrome [Chloroflexi bacterium]|nr:c-type cytochrome [Chloroflexota bacterium]
MNKMDREDYSQYLRVGLGLILLLILSLGYYWISDGTRLASAAEELSTERIHRGQDFYEEQCGACHGVEGEGGLGPALNDRQLLKNTLNDVFFSVIRSGVPNTQMPAWSVDFGGPLTDEDIRDVVAFMRAWEPEAVDLVVEETVPDPARGAVLFANTCAVCHGDNGLGGQEGIPVINDLERLNRLEDAWYRDVIANGRPSKGMPTWGTVFSPQQLDDLVALIGAWREGIQITPSFSATDLIDQAIFALQQEDANSASLHIDRALTVVAGAGVQEFENILGLLEAEDVAEAEAALISLREGWPPGDPASGAILYNTNCAVCHGQQGEGGVGTALIENSYVQEEDNSALVQFLLEGRPGTAMSAFEGRLTETELADLVAFLRLWQE